MSTTNKKRGLTGGRGLDALLGGVRKAQAEVEAVSQSMPSEGELKQLPIESLSRGRYQPRRDMDATSLAELADSIRAQGILQPIVVRKAGENRYEIIAGERRWRAAQQAQLADVPVVIRDFSDETAIAMALIENIQREDLNPLEEALAMQRFADEFKLSHAQVADAVGKSRSAVSNLLRLLSLQDDVKTFLAHGDIEMGHARALLPLPAKKQLAAAKQVIEKGLTVRHTEALVKSILDDKDTHKTVVIDPNVRRLQDDLSEKLGATVQINCNARGKGKLVISYNSLDELDGILAHIQ